MRFTIENIIIIKWMWVKKYVEKRLLKMFSTEDEVIIIIIYFSKQHIKMKNQK